MEKIVGLGLNIWSKINDKHSVELAYQLFSTPRKGKFKGQLPLFLQSAHTEFFLFEGLNIQTYCWRHQDNSKPVLLLVHGWQSNSLRWQQLIELLAPHYTIVAIDAIGLGNSQGNNLSVPVYSRLLIEVLRIYTPDYAIAHSLGAFALLQGLCIENNDILLKKIILLGALDKFNTVIEDFYKLLGISLSLQDKFNSYLRSMIPCDLEVYRSLSCIACLSCSTKLFVLHDKHDQVVPLEDSLELHQALVQRGDQLFYSESLGHSMQDPLVYNAILRFLQTQ